MHIAVYGPGCARCNEVERLAREAAAEQGGDITVEKKSDLKEMMALGIMSTPALAVNGKVLCTGRIPDKAEILAWLAAAR